MVLASHGSPRVQQGAWHLLSARHLELIIKRHFAVQQLVHFAASRGIEQNDPLAARQPLAQVDMHAKLRLPSSAFLGFTLNLHVDPLWRNAFVRCDRSESQRDSTAQRGSDQLDGAGRDARVIVALLYLQQPLADPNLCAALDVPDLY